MSIAPVAAVPIPTVPSTAPAAAGHTGMGAIPYPGGVTFRVWSIFADSVSVAGDFNGWSTTATPLGARRHEQLLVSGCAGRRRGTGIQVRTALYG